MLVNELIRKARKMISVSLIGKILSFLIITIFMFPVFSCLFYKGYKEKEFFLVILGTMLFSIWLLTFIGLLFVLFHAF